MSNPTIIHRASFFAAGVLLACTATFAFAQQEQYRESEVLDPNSDEWVAHQDAPLGEPADDLDEARRLLATSKHSKAKKLLEKWTEENPDHERYFEGLFLLGEAKFEGRRFYQAYEDYEIVADSTGGDLFYKTLQREMDVARAFLSGEKRIVWKFMRLSAYDEGIEILDRIWERSPGTALGEKALKLKADYFFVTGDVDLAQDEYANLAREYPNGRYVQPALLRSAEAAAAAFPGIQFDDRALLNAEVRYKQVNSAFPAYAERERVPDRLEGIRQQRAEKDLDIARWYEKTKRVGSAEFYYKLVLKDWPDTLAAEEARQALVRLGVSLDDEESQS